MINQQLKDLGLNDTEIAIYLAVLKAGVIAPSEIADVTSIKRTTVYSAAKSLVKRGLIAEDLSRKTSRLSAVSPKNIGTLIDEEQRRLELKKKSLKPLIAALEKEAALGQYPIPKIQFIAEEEINRFLYQQTPVWNQSALESDSTWWGYQDPSFVEQYRDWINWYWGVKSSDKLCVKILSNEEGVEGKLPKYPRREIRYWEPVKEFTATSWAIGDYLVMLVTNRSPHYLLEIHDKLMAHNLREFCKGVWAEIEKNQKGSKKPRKNT